ncbi:MAG: hypothetical protein MJZ61_08755 [Bacteroidales bacterium]|nr:hypothetical protein [Bacteroidales bacterium]
MKKNIQYPYIPDCPDYNWTQTSSKAYICEACGAILYGHESMCPDCGIHFGKPMESVSNYRGYQLKYFWVKKK